MAEHVFTSGPFSGVSVHDTFALAASEQEPVVVKLSAPDWPPNLAPTPTALGSYSPGEKIIGPLNVQADALIVLYTDYECRALLDVFTQNNSWSPARKKQWCGYAHNFANFSSNITGIGHDTALENGMFGYLSAVKIGTKNVVLYKSELHPKQNGPKLPFIPVMRQLISELQPALVISTGTAGAIGSYLNCGDVAVTDAARFHCETNYPTFAQINTMSDNETELTNSTSINTQYLDYAVTKLTNLSLPGLSQCYNKLQSLNGYDFVKKNTQSPGIYVTGANSVPGPQPMVVVSADYLTVDDDNDSEGLQPLGIMNETDDAFLFYAIKQLTGTKPQWLSVRNASEPQIVAQPFPPGTSNATIINRLKAIAGSIYGIYQYCTTLNSAFACWGIIAGM